MRVLVVEDEPRLAEQLAEALGQSGYAVDIAPDGEEGGFLGDTEPYDAVVLDLGLPKVDGLTVLKRWRADGRSMPVLILTARDSWHEKVAASTPAPTTIWRSHSRWRNCWRACVPLFAGPAGMPSRPLPAGRSCLIRAAAG